MNTILYFQSPSKTSAPGKIAGVRRHADAARWHLQIIDGIPDKPTLSQLAGYWQAAGAIVECGGGYQEIPPSLFEGMKVVYLDRNPRTLGPEASSVSHDSVATGQMAAKELLMTGYRDFAFVPYPEPRFWSDDRQTGFREALALNGKTCRIFKGVPNGSLQSVAWQMALSAWLADLPKPCGIFAANDAVAAEVLAAAALSGIEVPRDAAVCGVDNFEPVCEHTSPTLTSVEPDFVLAGLLAARTLEELVHSKAPRPVRLKFGPASVARRASTRLFNRLDPEAAAAAEAIRRRATEGISSADVLKFFKCSRRMAEMRFRQAAGHSIMEEIHAVRLEKARNLLSRTSLDIAAIANFCGFADSKAFWKFFRAETGLSPRAFRRNCLI